MSWAASGSNDWVTLSDSTGTNSGTITANYHTNNSKSPRTCIITFTASDTASEATGSPREITIVQQGKIDADDTNSNNGWGSSNILASEVQEDFAGMDGAQRMQAVSMQEIIETCNIRPIPEIIASGVSHIFRIEPVGVYTHPVYIKIPVDAITEHENLAVYYYSESPSHSGWYQGGNVQGWMVPGSTRILSEDGQTYVEFAINHSGIVQLGENKQLSLGGIASLDVGIDTSSRGWKALGGILALMGVVFVFITRKYHPSK